MGACITRCFSFSDFSRPLRVGSGFSQDQFHNSKCGYRAQYFHSICNGEAANAYTLLTLAPRIKQLLTGHEKRTCPWWWVEKSLLDGEAKVWIHQGAWLRQRRNSDRNLHVPRWRAKCGSSDSSCRKKALWGSLTPADEPNLDIKGGFLDLQGTPLGNSLKPSRSTDIHNYGFT